MSLSSKILIFLGTIIVIFGLGFIIFKQNEIANRQLAIETQIVKQKELVDGIMRSQNSYATKDDIKKFAEDNNVNIKAIQSDLDKLHAEITAVNVIIASSTGQVGNNLPSSQIGEKNPSIVDIPDPYGYLHNQQMFSLGETFGSTTIPFGQVGFSAWQPNPWSVQILPREYKLTNVIGTDENQRTYVYNKFSVKVDNKEYDVKISAAETKQEYPEAKWSWWNPKLFLTVGPAANVNNTPVKPNLNVGGGLNIMSYGKFKSSPDISVLGVGAGYEFGKNEFVVIANPVSYNIGKLLPNNIMSNTYIGPSLQVSIPKGTVFIGGNISLNL